MTELQRLQRAIWQYETANRAQELATKELRAAVRAYLTSKTEIRGEGVVLAKRLGISLTQLSNLKHGHSIASAEWARHLMKVCGDE